MSKEMSSYECNSWREYVDKAMDTCLPQCNNIIYGYLEVKNEIGEVYGKIKKWIRKDYVGREEEFYSLLEDELGDVLWGMACFYQNVKKEDIGIYWHFHDEKRVYKKEDIDDYKLIFSINNFIVLFDTYKNYTRIDANPLLAQISCEVYDSALTYFHRLLDTFTLYFDREFDIRKICERNIAKLQSRKERGKIQGDGDTR